MILICANTRSPKLCTGKLGIAKNFTSEANAPILELSFVITCIPQDKTIGDNDNDDELTLVGRLELQLWRKNNG